MRRLYANENAYGRTVAAVVDDRTRRIVLAGLVLGMSLAAIDLLVVATAVPDIAGDLGNLSQVSWVFTAYLLTYTTSMLLYGRLGDVLGRKTVFQAAIAIFVVASVFAGAAQSMTQLVIARALQGIGGGGLITLTAAIIADLVPARERGRYAGLTSSVWAVCSLLGPVIGGVFVDHLSWRWIFFVNIPAGAAAFALVGAALHTPARRVEHRLDLSGTALLVVAVGSLLLVTTWAGTEYEWGSATIISLAVVGVLTTIGFAMVERRVDEPLLPTVLLRNPVLAVCSAATFLAGSSLFGLSILLPLFLQIVNGKGAAAAGFVIAPIPIGIAVCVDRGRPQDRAHRSVPRLAGRRCPAVRHGTVALGHDGREHPIWRAARRRVPVRHRQWAVDAGLHDRCAERGAIPRARHRDRGRDVCAFSGPSVRLRLARRGDGSPSRRPPRSHRARTRLRAPAPEPAAVRALEPALRADVIDAFSRAITEALALAVPIALAAGVVSIFIRDLPLRDTIDDEAELGAAIRTISG